MIFFCFTQCSFSKTKKKHTKSCRSAQNTRMAPIETVDALVLLVIVPTITHGVAQDAPPILPPHAIPPSTDNNTAQLVPPVFHPSTAVCSTCTVAHIPSGPLPPQEHLFRCPLPSRRSALPDHANPPFTPNGLPRGNFGPNCMESFHFGHPLWKRSLPMLVL